MATCQRRNGMLTVTVRVKGQPSASETFIDDAAGRTAAKEWASRTHAQMKLGIFVTKATKRQKEAQRKLEAAERDEFDPLFCDAVDVWVAEHASKLKSYESEKGRIRIIKEDKNLNGRRLSEMKARHITLAIRAWQKEGLKGSTVRNRCRIVQGVFRHFMPLNEDLKNPFERVTRPKAEEARERRLMDGEEEKLLKAAEKCRWKYLGAMIVLAIETSWRQGELRQIRWKEVNLKKNELYLPKEKSKNGKARYTPLSPRALAAIKTLPPGIGNASIWGPREPSMAEIVNRFRKTAARAGMSDFRFHDLRHEACSRLHERGFPSVDVMTFFSGHKTLAMLGRYTNLYKTKSIHERLAELSAAAP